MDEIESSTSEVTHHDAGPENVRRMAAAGWPLSGIGGADGDAGAEPPDAKTGGAPETAPPA